MLQNMGLGVLWGGSGAVVLRNYEATSWQETFALIAPIHHVLHWVYFHNKAIPNAPKHYEMHQNMSLGSNGVDQVRSLRNITMWLRGTNFWINWPVQYVLKQVSCSYETIPNAPKYYETHRNNSLGSNGVDWVCSLQKNPDVTSWHDLLH